MLSKDRAVLHKLGLVVMSRLGVIVHGILVLTHKFCMLHNGRCRQAAETGLHPCLEPRCQDVVLLLPERQLVDLLLFGVFDLASNLSYAGKQRALLLSALFVKLSSAVRGTIGDDPLLIQLGRDGVEARVDAFHQVCVVPGRLYYAWEAELQACQGVGDEGLNLRGNAHARESLHERWRQAFGCRGDRQKLLDQSPAVLVGGIKLRLVVHAAGGGDAVRRLHRDPC
mmetsp:Transcript_82025/g.206373  ORF Transcript_82025/g.206373 Transcript_82025/m.206373 type:complete len:226 (+) Transcript_82025:421-1098(+)